MLVLTEAAAEVVKSVTSAPQTPDGRGLRIASSASEPEDLSALRVAAAPGPGANDQVIEASGARVFLDPQAAAYLDDKVLDAELNEQGKAHLILGMQDGGLIQSSAWGLAAQGCPGITVALHPDPDDRHPDHPGPLSGSGPVVSEVLGHVIIAVTKDVYGHPLEGDKRAAAESMSRALFGG